MWRLYKWWALSKRADRLRKLRCHLTNHRWRYHDFESKHYRQCQLCGKDEKAEQ